MNETKTLAAELRRYNAWRRGDETIAQPKPVILGELIAEAADRLEELERDLAESRQWSSKLADVADDMRADLAAERELADRLAALTKDCRPFCEPMRCRLIDEALAAWKEARNQVPSEAEIDAHLDECIAKSALSWKPLPGDEP